jgi:ComF family protein
MPAPAWCITIAYVIARLVRDVIDFCYPGLCASCGKGSEPGDFLCANCDEQLAKLERAPACDLCAMPVAYTDAPCPFCEGRGEPNYEQIIRLGTFDDPLKDLIHKMKYQGRWNVGEQLATRLLDLPHIVRAIDQADVLIPVPLHFLRQITRGYNQAGVIARQLSRRSAKPIAAPLTRVRRTETQTHFTSRRKRFKNLKDAFKLIDSRLVAGKRVLVIDDVMTTGATLQTVARALRPAHPAAMSAIVLAVADPRGRGFKSI